MTGYTWNVSSGGTITGGGGMNDNTMTVTWNTAGAQNVSVIYTNTDGCTAAPAIGYAVTVNPLPVPTISGPAAACATSTGNIYSTEPGMTGYLWDIATGGTISTGAGTDSVTVTWNTAGVHTIDVIYTDVNTCTAAIASVYNVTVNALPVPVITGAALPCLNTTNNYSTDSGMTGYSWTVSLGGSINGPSTNSTVSVTWNTTGAQSVSVVYTDANNCTATAASVYNVTVNPLPVPMNNGPGSVCLNSTGNTYITDLGMTGYSWTVSPGGIVQSGGTATDNTITLTWNSLGAQVVSVNYTNANGCTASSATQFNVTVNPLPVPTITGSSDACVSSINNIYTTESGMTGYTWNVPAGGTITAGAGTNSITVTWTTTGLHTASVNYTDTNSCTSATATVHNVTVNPLPVPLITGLAATCVNSSGNSYSTDAGMTGYVWDLSAGGIIDSGTGTDAITVTWNTTGIQTVSVNFSNGNGCQAATPASKNITVNALPVPTVSGPNSVCATSGGNIYSTQAGNSGYLWTATGGTITSGQGTASIEVTWNTPGTQAINVTYTDINGCQGISSAFNVNVNPLPIPVITGALTGCESVSGNVYSTATGMSNYTWSISTGGTITSGQGTNTVTVTWDIPSIQTLSVIYTDLNSCTAQVSGNMAVDVHNYPVSYAGNDDYICSDQTQYQFDRTVFCNYYDPALISWTFTGGDGALNATNILNPIYIPGPIDLSTVNRTITFTLTLQGTGNCSGITVSDDVILRIDPTPVSNAGPNGSICGERPYQITATAFYQDLIRWRTLGDGTFSDSTILRPTYTPGPNDVGNIIQLTMLLEGCQGLTNASSLWLTVYTEPTAVLTGSFQMCEGLNAQLSIALTGTPPWSISYDSGAVPSTASGIMASPYVITVAPSVTTTYTLTGVGDAHCPGPAGSFTGTATVSVNALPQIFIVTTTNNGNYCQGGAGVHLGLSDSEIGMTYQLLFNGNPDGAPVNGTGNAIDFGLRTATGQYTVRGTNPIGNCDAMMTGLVNVVMNPTPVIDFTTTTACFGDSTYFTVTGQYINRISTWHWDFGDGAYANYNAPHDPVHNYPDPGTYTVHLAVTDTNGCQYEVTHAVVVNPLPAAFFSYVPPPCDGSAIQFTDLSAPVMPYIHQWVWDYGDGSPLDTVHFPADPNVGHLYPGPGTYMATLTITNSSGCADTFSAPITITARPTAAFSFVTTCAGQQVAFADNSLSNAGGAITLWQWDFGDPISGVDNTSTLPSPTHVYASGGTYTVRLIVANYNGCRDTASNLVTVQAGPLADFTMGAGCMGGPAYFWADSVLINMATTASYLWDFGDGGSGNVRNTSHIYNAPGIYTVRLSITDLSGCTGFMEKPLAVSPLPVAHFDATLSNCQGEAVGFTDLSSSVTGYIVRRTWDFGDGDPPVTINFPNNPNVGHQYAGSGTFNVTLTVTGSDSCQGQETRQVSILPGPLAAYQFTGACQDQPVTFTDQSLANGGTLITTWTWDFGDPASGTNNTSVLSSPTHHFTGTGPYNVQLIVSTNNGCNDTVSQQVALGARPAVAFTSMNRCVQSPVAFTPDATLMFPGAIAQWNWDFGDGTTTTDINPTHSYANAGSYAVILSVADTAGCNNDTTQIIQIVPLPQVNFDYTAPTCHQAMTDFTSLATPAGGYLVRWHWDFGDGQDTLITFPDSPNLGHLYANSGTFNVTLSVMSSDSCANQYGKTVTVMPNPIAAFSHGSPCAGAAIGFTDASQGNGGGNITLWQWDFGDPATGTSNSSALPNPAHTYGVAGTYTVILVVNTANGCSDSVTGTLTIAAPPTIGFTFQAGCSVDTTQFTSSTIVNMATTAGWSWDFGDGTTSALPDPMHIYSQSGTFTVLLAITDTGGCQNTMAQPVAIVPGPAVYFSTSVPLCSAHAVTFTDGTLPGPGSTLSSWHWDFGDGHDTTLGAGWTGQIVHTYAGSGTYNVQLSAGTGQGCEGSYQQIIGIGAAPTAAFGFSNTCQGGITQFNDQSSAPGGITLVSWAWDFGNPASGTSNTSSLPNPTHIYAQSGTFITTLVVINAIGCSDTIQDTVIIHDRPGVDFTADGPSCLGTATLFYTDATATDLNAIAAFDWDFGDGGPHAAAQDPSHIYANASIYTVTLSVADTLGCTNQISHTVSIHALPTAAFSFSSACKLAATQFSDQSFAPAGETITGWSWDFGTTQASNTSNLQDPAYTYTESGTYNVLLTATTQNGCSQSTTMPVQVNAKPTANFTYTASPCAGGAVQFRDSSWTYQGIITSWQWEFEPNQYSILQSPVHVYFNVDSNYSVQLVVTDMRGCMDTLVQIVKVPAALQAGISYAGSCFGSASTFAPQLITPTGDTLINFAWDFGDPATGSGNSSTLRWPSHIFSQPGDYTVSLTAGDPYGCQSTVYQAITVYALPQATFTWQPGVCDSTIYFTQQSSAAGGPITRWAWDYGDGTGDTLYTAAAANTSHKYGQAGRYQVKLEITDTQGCTALFSDSITRGSCLTAAFSNKDTLCQGATIYFTDQSTGQGPISQWEWDFGEPASGPSNFSDLPSPTHTYQLPGPYTIKLKVSTVSGSGTTSDSTAHQIMVRPSPTAGFESKGSCLGVQGEFRNTTMANGATLTGYRWDFGETALATDTSSQHNGTYLYTHSGSYNVRLIAQSLGGCSDTMSRAVAVYGLPRASFDITNACQGLPTYFFDHSDSALAPLVHRGWTISDSLGVEARVSGDGPAYIFRHSGPYTVLLTVADTNGCTGSSQAATQVRPVPTSAFAYVQDAEGIQGQLQMENQSSGAVDYEWDFGDGTSSPDGEPKVLYTLDGTYTIKLIAWNTFNCPDTSVKEYKLLVKGLYVPNAFAPGSQQPGVGLFLPVGVNLAYYHVEVYNSHGNLIWESKMLDEKGSPAEGWDGSYKGNMLQQDVYLWKIRAIFRDGAIWDARDLGDNTGLGDKTYGTVILIR